MSSSYPDCVGKSAVIIDSVYITPTEEFTITNLVPDVTICMGDSTSLYGQGNYSSSNPPFANNTFTYKWVPQTNMGHLNTNITKVAPSVNTTYYLEAYNKINCKEVDSVTVFVTKPVANFTIDNDYICQGETMSFTDISSCNNGIVAWKWELYSGETSTLQNPSFVMNNSGNFGITLKTTDINGDISVISKIIHVMANPDLPIISGLNNNCDSDKGVYEIDSPNSNHSYNWYIDGNLIQSNGTQLQVQWSNYFPTPNMYIDIKVVVTNSNGCESESIKRIFNCCGKQGWYFNNATIDEAKTIVLNANNQLFINGTLKINANVEFVSTNNGTIYMGPMARIELGDKAKLSFNNVSLRSDCNYMWDGIYLYSPDNKLNVSNQSTIQDAVSAINSENGGQVIVTNSVLQNNYKGITISNSKSLDSPLFISESIIKSNDYLPYKPYKSYISNYGIKASNCEYVFIGDSSDVSKQNKILNHEYGIIINKSDCKIYNNRFEKTVLKSISITQGKKSTTEHFYSYIGGSNSSNLVRSNEFESVTNAIYAVYPQSIYIDNNNFRDIGFWNVIEMRDVTTFDIEIKNNNFDKIKFAARIYNSFNASITIKDNIVENAEYGFGVLNTHSAGINKLLIRENSITIPKAKIYSRAIQIINIKGQTGFHIPMAVNWKRAIIDNNKISFVNIDVLDINKLSAIGIDVQNSIMAYVQHNSIKKNYPEFDNDNAFKYIGIRIENSPNTVLCSNYINNFGYAIECKNSSPNNRIVDTDMDYCNYGVNLNNAHIANQGYSFAGGITYDNRWTNMIGTSKIKGYSIVRTDWYYRDGNIYMDPNPSAAIGLFNLPLSEPRSMKCGIDFDPSFNEEPYTHIDYFERSIKGGLEYSLFKSSARYFNHRYIYTVMRNNDEFRELLFSENEIYSSFYKEIETTSIASFEQFDTYIYKNDIKSAQTTLAGISKSTTFDECEFNADEIYLNTWALNNYDLDPSQTKLLRKYAQANSLEIGPAVYTARVMVGMESMANTFRVSNPIIGEPIINNNIIKVFPNPTNGDLKISSSIELNNAVIEIYSVLGKQLKLINLSARFTSINISDLNQGVYVYRIIENTAIIDTGKIIINK